MRFEVEGFPPVEVGAGQTMLEVCEGAGIPMNTACGGFAACNSCRVQVLAGAEHLDPTHPEEEAFLDHADERLGCQARFLGSAGGVRVRLAPGA